MDRAQKLRDLASWYREFAERAGNSAIWDARLRTAEKLEEEATSLEHAANLTRSPLGSGRLGPGPDGDYASRGLLPSSRRQSMANIQLLREPEAPSRPCCT
jgi:hypothetical protein